MPNNEKSREVNLDNRHLVAFFIGSVIVCGAFFALGYFVGVGESRTNANALPVSDEQNSEIMSLQDKLDSTSKKGQGKNNNLANSENITKEKSYKNKLDFYSAVRNSAARTDFSPKKAVKKPTNNRTNSSKNRSSSYLNQKKILSLQVSAVKNRTEAERLAQDLRNKGYPVFVLAPSKRAKPAWIRVQVGPFKDMKKVSEIKTKLKKDGYPSFLQSK